MNTLQAKIALNNYRKLKVRITLYTLLGIGAILLNAWGNAN